MPQAFARALGGPGALGGPAALVAAESMLAEDGAGDGARRGRSGVTGFIASLSPLGAAGRGLAPAACGAFRCTASAEGRAMGSAGAFPEGRSKGGWVKRHWE